MGTWVFLSGAATPAAVAELQDASLAYDAEADATLLLTKQKVSRKDQVPVDVWAYRAAKDEWSTVRLSGPAPTGDFRWGLLVYDGSITNW